MDYQKATRTRKTGLFRLIAKKKFEEGQGLGSSIGGAVSEKFKSYGKGIQESLDPLNWTRKIFGKGLAGDLAVTGLGRMFGRKEETIDYFGGFKKKKKKDPSYSTISAGVVTPLKYGDSVADILAKMYNFTLKTDEKRKLQDELENSFRQELIDEENRRHAELIKAIRGMKGKKGAAGGAPGGALSSIFDNSFKDLFSWSTALLTALAAALSEFLGDTRLPTVPSSVTKTKINPPVEKPKPDTKPKPGEKPKPGRVTKTINKKGKRKGKGKAKTGRTSTRAPKPETVKPTATKVETAIKGAGSLKAVNGLIKFLTKAGLNKVLIGANLIADLVDIAKNPPKNKKGELDVDEIERLAIRSLAATASGVGGAELFGALGAAAGTVILPGWGTLIGGLVGGTAGYMAGDKIARKLFDLFTKPDEVPEPDIAAANKYLMEHGGAVSEQGAAFGVRMHGIPGKKTETPGPENETLKALKQSFTSTTTPRHGMSRMRFAETPVPPSTVQKDVSVPKEITPEMAHHRQSSVSVNNTVNTMRGNQSKVLNTSVARTRNSDMDIYVTNNAANF
jgi:hypothetical protein